MKAGMIAQADGGTMGVILWASNKSSDDTQVGRIPNGEPLLLLSGAVRVGSFSWIRAASSAGIGWVRTNRISVEKAAHDR